MNQREIIFKAKTHSGEWVFGTPHFTNSVNMDRFVEICDTHNGLGTVALRQTLGQYTGVKDKNGREIYEGDLVLLHGIEKCVVRWESINAMFEALGQESYSLNAGFGAYEVIGNVYDNIEDNGYLKVIKNGQTLYR